MTRFSLLTSVALSAVMPAAALAQLAPTPGVTALGATAQPNEAAAPNLGAPEDIIVTGTRQTGRTKADSTAPVDAPPACAASAPTTRWC